ncbi:MAG: ADP compounds hydrolase NudE [Candidatus Erwinia impunctatus]|nr:ADP compounds hydrolase NudE [Culicoides impunctatus]
MRKQPEKPLIQYVTTIACSGRFKIEEVALRFSNGEERLYERLKSSGREAVMIVPIIDGEVILIQEYAVGAERYTLGFPKGLIDEGETPFQVASRELQEEIGFSASELNALGRLTLAPSYFSSTMHIVVAEKLYESRLEGDEPEPLILHRCPLGSLLSLLEEHDFSEARNVSAQFMVREWLVKQGRLNY